MSLFCPDCSQALTPPSEARIGTVVICENCGAEVEITSLNPLEGRAIEEMK